MTGPRAPEQIGKYRILGRRGRGGMGTVFRAHDPVLGREVALKVISPEVEMTEDLRARFYREAQACAQLSHPNIVTIHDLGEDQGRLFIVMELVDGEELRRLITARQPAALDARLALLAELADGLRYAHEKGIVHRDVKPANILVTPAGHAKILDFGLARMGGEGAGLTRTGLVMGTLRYMSPEQARGKVDHRSDVFSLGAVAYELCAFRPPFPAEDPLELLAQIKDLDPPALPAIDPAIPEALDAIVRRALAKDPGARYQDLGQMRADLLTVRDRLAAGAGAHLARVRTKLAEVARLRTTLAARSGQADDAPTEVVPDERRDPGRLAALERQLDAELERLRGRIGMPPADGTVLTARVRTPRVPRLIVTAAVALIALGAGIFVWRPGDHPAPTPATEGAPPPARTGSDVTATPSSSRPANPAPPAAPGAAATIAARPGPGPATGPAAPAGAPSSVGAPPGGGIAPGTPATPATPHSPLATPPSGQHGAALSPPTPPPPVTGASPPTAQGVSPPGRPGHAGDTSSPVTAETAPEPPDRPTSSPGAGADPGVPPVRRPRPLAGLRAPGAVGDPHAAIREVIDGYKRAVETRDVPLMRQLRPGVTPAELGRLQRSFDENRSHTVELRIDEIEVTPPDARASGQRADTLVSKDGRTLHNEAPVVFRLRRLPAGWVIVAID